jgi:hypothetical protein
VSLFAETHFCHTLESERRLPGDEHSALVHIGHSRVARLAAMNDYAAVEAAVQRR